MKKYFLLFLFFIHFNLVYSHEGSVVCLHGFFRSFRCMIPIANCMRDEGLNVYLWDYPSRRKCIEEHADCLVELLNAIAIEHPSKPIHFVTHSLGGIIVRTAMNRPNCPREAKIGRAVLLAPPNRGAALARNIRGCPMMRLIFGKKAGKQLLTYSEEDMLRLGEFPPTMQVMVIAGKKHNRFFNLMDEPNDGKVSIEETKLNTPHTHHVLHVSHNWIMTSRESIHLVKHFLLEPDSQPNVPGESAQVVDKTPDTF